MWIRSTERAASVELRVYGPGRQRGSEEHQQLHMTFVLDESARVGLASDGAARGCAHERGGRAMRTLEAPVTRLVAAGDGRTVKYVALAWLIWLPLMLPMISALLAAHPGPLHTTLSLLGLAVFVVLYVRTAWRNARKVTGLVLLP